jgi:signal transduction histidine kinase
MDACVDTHFAPAARAPREDILRSREAIARQSCQRLADALPHPVMVLNRCRQLVFGNDALRLLLAQDDLGPSLGRRPGELFRCIHADAGPSGCGTSEFCRECGAVRAILGGLAGRTEVQECRMLRLGDRGLEALDLRVHSVPYVVDGEAYTVFSVLDVSHEKRRRILERIFFHDILNTAGGVCGILSILNDDAPEGLGRDLAGLHDSMQTLQEEIYSQRDLLAAEHGELVPRMEEVRAADVLRRAAQRFARHPLTRRRKMELGPCPDAALVSDPVLLGRILGNMLKNALEAVPPGSTVLLGGEADADWVRFFVRNPGRLKDSEARQVFKRSFSTKGPDRGLGAYSMRLLGERYLGGSVSFAAEGDVVEFSLRLPRQS